MIMIVPCCGQSERYRVEKKQFIKLPNKLPLPVFSQSGITNVDKTIYTFIEHDFNAFYGTSQLIWGGEICLLNKQTSNQVETIRQTIIKCGLQNSDIYIKDCDNYFQAEALPNIVTVQTIISAKFKLQNKSYTKFDSNGFVIKIAERSPISGYINVGGYGFVTGELFLKNSIGATYVSEVINKSIKKNTCFSINKCEKYIDYGEQDDFDKFIKTYHK